MYRIEFEDKGQDLTSLTVDDDGVIIDAGFHTRIFKGCVVVDIDTLDIGDLVYYYNPKTDENRHFKYYTTSIQVS